MEFELKPISPDSISEALAKVERYRLLNEPSLAESICLDILIVAPNHQQALIALLLARTEQFGDGVSAQAALEILSRIHGEYERDYYEGIIRERMAHAQLREGRLGGAAAAYHKFREAMRCFERAEAVRPSGNDDPILRWNTCARVIMRNPDIRPLPHEEFQPITSE
jgi:hypothetical protein